MCPKCGMACFCFLYVLSVQSFKSNTILDFSVHWREAALKINLKKHFYGYAFISCIYIFLLPSLLFLQFSFNICLHFAFYFQCGNIFCVWPLFPSLAFNIFFLLFYFFIYIAEYWIYREGERVNIYDFQYIIVIIITYHSLF